jgi:hypothetical protein
MRQKNQVCIVIAGGKGTRWNNHLGRRKHFIDIDGEAIIKRTIRLLKRYCQTIYVVANAKGYTISGSTLYRPKLNRKNYDADKFLNSQGLWNREGRTIVLYGDVYFTKDAIRHIMTHEPREWALFARFGPSDLTAKEYGECFAHSFYPEHIGEHRRALLKIVTAYSKGDIDRCGGWEHYRSMEGLALQDHQRKGRFVEINDWTDDFDCPLDYDMWLAARCSYGVASW